MNALRSRLDELAGDVGRLRQRLEPDTSLAHTADRIAGHVEALVLMVEPSAAEIAGVWAPGDDQAIGEAVRLVDNRHARLRHALGYRRAA